MGHFDWDILVMLIGSLLSFGIMLEPLGFYVSIFVLVIFSSMASHEFSLKIAIANALFLLLFAYLAFNRGLKLVMPLTPNPFSEWQTYQQILIPALFILAIIVGYFKIKQVKLNADMRARLAKEQGDSDNQFSAVVSAKSQAALADAKQSYQTSEKSSDSLKD